MSLNRGRKIHDQKPAKKENHKPTIEHNRNNKISRPIHNFHIQIKPSTHKNGRFYHNSYRSNSSTTQKPAQRHGKPSGPEQHILEPQQHHYDSSRPRPDATTRCRIKEVDCFLSCFVLDLGILSSCLEFVG